MYDKKSRYAEADRWVVVDARGREVTVTGPYAGRAEATLGLHVRREGERLDHLAHGYLGDATQFWRILEHNDAFTEDQLAEEPELWIPSRSR